MGQLSDEQFLRKRRGPASFSEQPTLEPLSPEVDRRCARRDDSHPRDAREAANKAHVEGAFGLFSPGAPALALADRRRGPHASE